MGNIIFKQFCEKGDGKKEKPKETVPKILFMGLGQSGKTSLVSKLTSREMPPLGFGYDFVKYEYNDTKFLLWDFTGRERVRSLYKGYMKHTEGLVFVMDSSDQDGIESAMTYLLEYLFDDEDQDVQGIPVLVLANKQDLPGVASATSIQAQVEERGYLKQHPWRVFGTSALSMDEQYQANEGMKWLLNEMLKRRKQQWFDEHVGKTNKGDENEAGKGDVITDAKNASKLKYFANILSTLMSVRKV